MNYLVFEAHPYEGYWMNEFKTLKEARDYAKSLEGNEDVTDVRIVKELTT